ncbi:MAG: hypothetical protein SGI92_15890 [Bryobacteraceae bacterium]|nr:hypothetical protein [Bryobacteraceae bacterium]
MALVAGRRAHHIANVLHRSTVRDEVEDIVIVLCAEVELGQVTRAIRADRVRPTPPASAPACVATTPVIGLV